MSIKKFALIALASSALTVPAYASNAEIDQLMKEINKLKAQVNAIQKKASEPAASAAPVTKPVIACEAHGNGFFVIPGTSTCLRISGYARGEASYVQKVGDPNSSNVTGGMAANNGSIDASSLGFAGRLRLNTDFRSSTEMGTLRGFGRLNLNLASNPSYSLSSNGSADGLQSASFSTAADLEYAYISLGGWSVGRQDSAFSFFARSDSADLIVSDDNAKILAASYTLPLGSGLSATLAAENPMQRISSAKENEAGMPNVPEIVGALQLVNGPMTVKFSGASHQIVREANADTAQGYAYQGGVKYVVSPETTLTLQGTYAKGAMNYLGYGITNSSASDISDPDEQFRVASVSPSADFNLGASGDIVLSEGWSVLGALNQKIGTGVFNLIGVYGNIENNRRYNATLANSQALEGNILQVEAGYTFKPYDGLNIQPAVAYQRWDLNEVSTTPDEYNVDRYGARIRVWREF